MLLQLQINILQKQTYNIRSEITWNRGKYKKVCSWITSTYCNGKQLKDIAHLIINADIRTSTFTTIKISRNLLNVTSTSAHNAMRLTTILLLQHNMMLRVLKTIQILNMDKMQGVVPTTLLLQNNIMLFVLATYRLLRHHKLKCVLPPIRLYNIILCNAI